MGIDSVAVYDVGLAPTRRKELPELLTEALRSCPEELEALGLKASELDQSRWVWDWNPDCDGEFSVWIATARTGLAWPTLEGIAVDVNNHTSIVSTGIRWAAVRDDEGFRGVVTKIVRAIGLALGAGRAWLIPDSGDAVASEAMDLVFGDAPPSELIATVGRSPIAYEIRCCCIPNANHRTRDAKKIDVDAREASD